MRFLLLSLVLFFSGCSWWHNVYIYRLERGEDINSQDNNILEVASFDVLAENHVVVATAEGEFDHTGGILESNETGVRLVIPPGAIPDDKKQLIYFKVCQDTSMLPPLDKEKGSGLTIRRL